MTTFTRFFLFTLSDLSYLLVLRLKSWIQLELLNTWRLILFVFLSIIAAFALSFLPWEQFPQSYKNLLMLFSSLITLFISLIALRKAFSNSVFFNCEAEKKYLLTLPISINKIITHKINMQLVLCLLASLVLGFSLNNSLMNAAISSVRWFCGLGFLQLMTLVVFSFAIHLSLNTRKWMVFSVDCLLAWLFFSCIASLIFAMQGDYSKAVKAASFFKVFTFALEPFCKLVFYGPYQNSFIPMAILGVIDIFLVGLILSRLKVISRTLLKEPLNSNPYRAFSSCLMRNPIRFIPSQLFLLIGWRKFHELVEKNDYRILWRVVFSFVSYALLISFILKLNYDQGSKDFTAVHLNTYCDSFALLFLYLSYSKKCFVKQAKALMSLPMSRNAVLLNLILPEWMVVSFLLFSMNLSALLLLNKYSVIKFNEMTLFILLVNSIFRGLAYVLVECLFLLFKNGFNGGKFISEKKETAFSFTHLLFIFFLGYLSYEFSLFSYSLVESSIRPTLYFFSFICIFFIVFSLLSLRAFKYLFQRYLV